MDFFARQRRARRQTTWLILLFAGWLALVVGTLYGATQLFLQFIGRAPATPEGHLLLFLSVVVLIGLVLGVAVRQSLKHLKRSGGATLATRLNGRTLSPIPSDSDEQMLQNVIEEMAVAAGLPVPWIYVLDDEPGINALTAGYRPRDAAIVVTGGALRQLSRDEMQALVAHEMSHLLYGDTRRNMYLLGVLDGLAALQRFGLWSLYAPSSFLGRMALLLALLMLVLLSFMAYVSNAPLLTALSMLLPLLALAGGAVALITGVGALFSRLVQRTVARQREYLADASAVQFTRLPQALAGVLRRIQRGKVGARILVSEASRAGHFFFAAPSSTLYFTDWLSTHPPIAERLARLPRGAAQQPKEAPESAQPPPDTRETNRPSDAVTDAHVQHSHKLLSQLPDTLYELAHDPAGAQAIVCALLLETDDTIRMKQLRLANQYLGTEAAPLVPELQESLRTLPATLRLPLVELALAPLRQLSDAHKNQLHRLTQHLMRANNKLSLFEFALYKLMDHWLYPSEPQRLTRLDLRQTLYPDFALLLSALAHVGSDSPREAHRAFEMGCATLDQRGALSFVRADRINVNRLDESLERLSRASSSLRHDAVDACKRCVLADEHVTVEEAELTRVIAALFDCPLPPFLPSLS